MGSARTATHVPLVSDGTLGMLARIAIDEPESAVTVGRLRGLQGKVRGGYQTRLVPLRPE